MTRDVKISLSESKIVNTLDNNWRKLICAGRAAEGLRADWREQLITVQKEIGFLFIRFHGLFHDEMMVCERDNNDKLIFNFHYIDSLFDFLLSINLKPFVELGFMPATLSSDDVTLFWWKAHVSPPRKLKEWEELIHNFICHCIDRYGLKEVCSWYFEVWNEPCIVGEFWSGTQQDYFDLYEATAITIKNICTDLKVGGPSSAFFKEGKAPWMDDFLDYVIRHKLPLDFITAHPYPVWWDAGEFSETAVIIYRDRDATAKDLNSLSTLLKTKQLNDVEIHVTEWNSSFLCRDMIHDTAYKAPFLIQNCLAVQNITDSLGYWVFSDVFEEHGPGRSLFHGGFGLLNKIGLKKAAYYGYWFLAKLGESVIEKGDNYIVTQSSTGYQILMWNYVHYKHDYTSSVSKPVENPYDAFDQVENQKFIVNLSQLTEIKFLYTYSYTRKHNSVYDNWLKIGAPEYPSSEVCQLLQESGKPELKLIKKEEKILDFSLEAHDVVMLEVLF